MTQCQEYFAKELQQAQNFSLAPSEITAEYLPETAATLKARDIKTGQCYEAVPETRCLAAFP